LGSDEPVRHAPPPPRLARVREPLWGVRLENQQMTCELRYHGVRGVEYRLFHNNEFLRGRGFATRELAVKAATDVLKDLEREGWIQFEI